MKATLRLFLLATFATTIFLLVSATAGLASGLQTSGTASSAATKKTPAKAPPSSQEITDAKAKGLVWVNTNTHVYHKSDSSMYGTTKRGRFMTEEDAKKAGFRAANESGTKKKAAGAGTQK